MALKTLRSLVVVCAICAVAPRVWAQQSIDLASIGGQITDPSGAVIDGATITARHLQTNVTTTAASDREGRFRLPYLRVGEYEITIAHEGFRDSVRTLAVAAGAAFELPVTLAVAGLDADVTVTAETALLEAARSQIASTLSDIEIRTVPMNGRNFLDLALLGPGVAPANVSSTQLFPETSAVPGVSLSVSSQRNLSNNFTVDGLSANDDAAGLSGMTYGVDAIEQFQVVTSGGQAELGRALGGHINVVTRSGTNVRSGTGYAYLRDDRLNAANPLTGTTLPMDQIQYGASAGGPLARNRTFYFGNFEQRRLDQTGVTTISPANVAAINARLVAVGYGGPLVTTGVYPNPVDTSNAFAKLDHRLGGRGQLGVRYSLYDVRAENSRGAGGLSAPSASSGLDNLDQMIAASTTFTMSSRTVVETRAQFAYSDLKAPATDPIGPAVSIAGVASFGTSSSSPTRRLNRLLQVASNLSHQAGTHAVRAGLDVLHNDDWIVFPRSARGAYSFASLPAFLSGVYSNGGFAQAFGVSDIAQANFNIGVYAQDEWKVHPQVTLNLGLRYDLQFLDTIDTDTNNLSPRAGFVWSPFASRRTLLRGSAGVFFDRVPLRPLANALLSAGNTTDLATLRQVIVSLSPAQAGAPAFPDILPTAVPSTTPVSLTTMDRDLQSAYSRQAGVELEQQLGASTTIAVGYQHLRGDGLLMSINQNVATCVAAGGNNGCRPISGYANNGQYSSAGTSTYRGLDVSLTRRPGRWGHYRVSYTLSKSMNDVGAFFFSSPIDPGNVTRDWGRSDDDRRHRLVASGAFDVAIAARTPWEHLVNGFQVSAVLQAYSALPLNVLSGVTTIQGTAGRPVTTGPTPIPLDVRTASFIARNAGVGSDYLSLNLRLSRTFRVGPRLRLEALVEGFNVTNHENVVTRNANFGPGAYPSSPTASFGAVTSVAEGRALQFGARVRF
jgi:hypothetical protein